MKEFERDRDRKVGVDAQRDILSVCLAVIRGRLTAEQAREAILGRTSAVPLADTLRLDPALVREAEEPARLPERDREQCLDLFKELYDATPAEKVLEEDGSFGRLLIQQRLVTAAQVEACAAIQKRLFGAGVLPLPRLGELLIRQGYLQPGQVDLATTRRQSAELPRTERLPEPATRAVQEAVADPSQRFGRYVRVSLLGEGGAGEVWKAWDVGLERWVALKFLKFEDADELARLKREAQTAAKLSHPNIAAVFEMGEANGRTFLVMEYIDGQTLVDYPRQDHRQLVSLLREVAQAIQYAHDQGLVHRDIKPGNIMVDSAGRPFILDFGLARHVNSDRSLGEHILGTPSYMSPEQARGGEVDARSDVWSLGATLYELLSDRPPFRGGNALDTLDLVLREEPRPLEGIAEDLRTIVSACLMKEPARRYASAARLAEDLRRWEEGEAIVAHAPSVFYRLRKKIAKRRAVLGVGLAGLFLSAGIAAWVLPRWRRADDRYQQSERQLAAERESRAGEARALALARPHVEEARKMHSRLDRQMATGETGAETFRASLDRIHRELDRALEITPNDPEALLEKAKAYGLGKDRARALEYYSKAVDASPGYSPASLSRARILLDSLEDLRRSLGGAETPESARVAETIRGDLRKVTAWSKDTEEISFGTGGLAVVDADYERAARVFEEYARANPLDGKGWEWAGRAWLHVPGMDEKAAVDFAEAIKLKPRQASLRVLLGRAHLDSARGQLRLERNETFTEAQGRAVAEFGRASDLDPADPEPLLGLADAELLAGDPAGAMAELDRAVERSGGAPAVLVARARARLRLQDREGALADAEEALRRDPRNPAALVVRGSARCLSSDVGGAQADFEEALSRAPAYAPAFVGLGDVLRERGEPERAAAEYGKAIGLDPALAEAYARRGASERDRGREDAAIRDLSRALELDPSDPYLRYDLGVSHGNQGDWAAAEREFRKGLALHPSRPDWFRERLWLARAKHGEAGPAREEFAAWLRERPSSLPGRLAPKINELIAGSLSEAEFLALLESTEYSRVAIAEGYFIAGEKALVEGRTARAAELFGRCMKTGARTSQGYSTAQVELKGLTGR
jgi:tetratricopeptide (TPR) repeat protein/predicted Ser/Thr protein kinase